MAGFDVDAKSEALSNALNDYEIAFKAWQQVPIVDGGLGREVADLQSVFDLPAIHEQFNSIIDKTYDGIKAEIKASAYVEFTCVVGIVETSPGVWIAQTEVKTPPVQIPD